MWIIFPAHLITDGVCKENKEETQMDQFGQKEVTLVTNLDIGVHYLPITHQMGVCQAGKVELDPEVES